MRDKRDLAVIQSEMANRQIDHRLTLVGGCRDVEEHELVGAGGVVAAGQLDRIAGVAQIEEADALDDATAVDV